MKLLKYCAIICCCISIVACNDEISTLGSSLNDSLIEITVDSTSIKIDGKSIYNDSILGRTTDPLLGNLAVEGYGNLRTGYLSQFMPTLNIDTTNVTHSTLDSIKLYLSYYNKDLTGDSLAPMVLNIYRLNKTVKSPLYTNLNPLDYYSPSDLIAQHTFGSSTEGYIKTEADSTKTPYKRLAVRLPIELGQEIFDEYKRNPEIFSMPSEFAKFFPGIYMNVSYGNGRLVNIKGIYMTMHYRAINQEGRIDTLSYNYMGVTPEVYSINHFALTPDEKLIKKVEEYNASGKRVIAQAPVGYLPIIHFPTGNIIAKYQEKLAETAKIQNILNFLSFTIPVVQDENAQLDPPQYLLFIRASQVKDFFKQKLLPDDINTIYATYNKAKGVYDFGNISYYIRDILHREDPTVTEDDETIALIPVQVLSQTTNSYYESVTSVISVSPYCASPAITELDLEGAQIKIIYTTQTSNF